MREYTATFIYPSLRDSPSLDSYLDSTKRLNKYLEDDKVEFEVRASIRLDRNINLPSGKRGKIVVDREVSKYLTTNERQEFESFYSDWEVIWSQRKIFVAFVRNRLFGTFQSLNSEFISMALFALFGINVCVDEKLVPEERMPPDKVGTIQVRKDSDDLEDMPSIIEWIKELYPRWQVELE